MQSLQYSMTSFRAKVCYMAKYDDITFNEAEFHWNHKLNWQYAGEMHYLLYSDMAGDLKLIALTINTLLTSYKSSIINFDFS